MTRIKDPSLAAAAEAELPWLQRYIPLTRRVAAGLSEPVPMSHVGLTLSGGYTLCLTLARRQPIMGTLHRPPRELT